MTQDRTEPTARPETAVLDLDGTLVDSVYAHVLAWHTALADVGVVVPTARLHRAIGMGGDRLVAAVAGDAVERALGEEVRERHPHHLDRLFGSITATEGAAELLEELHTHDLHVVVATSSDPELAQRLLDLVPGSSRYLDAVVDGDQAEKSKPSGEIIAVALDGRDPARAVVIGDAEWDMRSAGDVGAFGIGFRTGGICAEDLYAAGAALVLPDPAALAAQIRETGSLLPVTG